MVRYLIRTVSVPSQNARGQYRQRQQTVPAHRVRIRLQWLESPPSPLNAHTVPAPLRFDSPAEPSLQPRPIASRAGCHQSKPFQPSTQPSASKQNPTNGFTSCLLGTALLPAAAAQRPQQLAAHTGEGIPATATATATLLHCYTATLPAPASALRAISLPLSPLPGRFFHQGPSGSKGVLGWGRGQTRQTPLGSPIFFLFLSLSCPQRCSTAAARTASNSLGRPPAANGTPSLVALTTQFRVAARRSA